MKRISTSYTCTFKGDKKISLENCWLEIVYKSDNLEDRKALNNMVKYILQRNAFIM